MMKQAIVLIVVLFLPCLAIGAVIHVPGDSATIQAGVNGASEGDTVLVADGTYSGWFNRNINFGGKNLVVTSVNGPEYTRLEIGMMQQSFIFVNGEDSSSVVEGFTIRPAAPYDYAGYLYISYSSPTIRNCVFDTCGAPAVWCTRCTTTVSDCRFQGCGSGGPGGGVYIEDSHVALQNCVFNECRSGNPGSGTNYSGAAMYCSESHVYLLSCSFTNNTANTGTGGAICGTSCLLSVSQCRFTDNSCMGDMLILGGAINAGGPGGYCFVSESLFDGNYSEGDGGAICCNTDSTLIVSCTFVGNESGEGHFGSSIWTIAIDALAVKNSIFAFNNGDGVIYAPFGLGIECTDSYGNSDGDWIGDMAPFADINGNFSLNPLFCDTANGDFSLAENSYCIPEKSPCTVLIGALGIGCDALCGDVNADDVVDIDDPVYLVSYVFSFGPSPIPLSVGDCDCSGGDTPVDIDDVVHLMDYILRGGPEPCDVDGDGVPDC